MMTSNIDSVVNRVRRMQEGIPAAVSRAVSPGYWKPRLEVAALKTLRAQWALERDLALRTLYEGLTPKIVATLSAELLEGPIARFTMGIPEAAAGVAGDVAGARSTALEGRTETGKQSKNFRLPLDELKARSENLEAVRQGILDWVKTEKHKETGPGGRDAGLSDEEIAERLEWIMGLGARQSAGDVTAEMQAAGERLANRIQAFMDSPESVRGSASGSDKPVLAPAVATAWLAAVLQSWRVLVMVSLPSRLKYEVERELKRISGSMI
jgi:DNA-binding PucR family transcriptional regulator